MPRRCIVFDTPMGRGIISMQVRKSELCECGRLRVALCDYPVGGGKTCDRPICEKCRTHVGKDTDYCKTHSGAADTQQPLFNGPQVPIELG